MTSTLLLRLSGPMQSWGTSSNFETRRTDRIPSKSGIVGMIGAALGMTRGDDFRSLSEKLRVGFRVDRPGKLLLDFHTVQPIDLNGKLTYREYLCDAVFLAGIESDDTTIFEISKAINNPFYPIYLGRRSCPPDKPVFYAIKVNAELEDSLIEEMPLVEDTGSFGSLPIYYEPKNIDSSTRFVRDEVVSFDMSYRHHRNRPAKTINKTLYIDHDPMAELYMSEQESGGEKNVHDSD